MDRKQFIGGSLQALAGLGFACPCLAAASGRPAEDKPAAAQGTAAGPAGAVASAAGACPPAAPAHAHATSYQARTDFAKVWTGRFMKVLDERLDEKTRCALMQANGRACAVGAYGPPDPKPIPVDDFVARLAGYVGKENARLEGDVVYFNYVGNPTGLKIADGYCLCPMVEDGPADLSRTYCQCSVGYVGYMFERNIGRPVRVELLESLRGGGKACRFAVHV